MKARVRGGGASTHSVHESPTVSPHKSLTLMRIRIQLFTSMRIRVCIQLFQLNGDADPDTAPHQSDGISDQWSADPDPVFIVMRIRIQFFTVMRIRIQLFTAIRIRIRIRLLKVMRIRFRNPGKKTTSPILLCDSLWYPVLYLLSSW
jgi:hypothetical protein